MNLNRKPWLGFMVLCLVLLAVACSAPGPYKRVSLKPTANATPITPAAPDEEALRVAVAAILSPRTTTADYDRLIAYMTNHLGRPVQLVQRATYAETNELIRTRQVDLAFVCTGAYIQGHKEFGMELLAVPEIGGEHTYRSYIIVPASSAARDIGDLRGRVFAFTDPLSLSGYMVPLYVLLTEMDRTPDTFFSRALFTYSHENSIKAVAEGWVDGAAVDSLVYNAILLQQPDFRERIRVLWQSPPYGAPPAVVHPSLDVATKTRLRQLLLEMHQTEEGRQALAPLGVDRFVPAEDALYDSARAVLSAIGGLR